MPIVDSKTGKVRKEYTVDELVKAASRMRALDMIALCAAGSGHSGGTLSMMDFTSALYLHEVRHDPENPSWEDRDRIIWSTGHKAPNLYIGLGMAGYFDVEDVARLRKLGSPFQGHPHWPKLPGVEASTGSLGQGLSIAIGIALAAKMDKSDYRVYCLMGDGEQQEGQIWEAVMEASNFKLDNLVGIIDRNRLQIDGLVKEVMNVESLEKRYKAFGWHVIEINGHDMKEILNAFDVARTVKNKPVMILANTIKGKGVSEMEDVAGWHGKAPNEEQMWKALEELGERDEELVKRMFERAEHYQIEASAALEAKMPKFSKDYFWNQADTMKTEMDPTRMGFGRALEAKGDDERVVCLGADISGSIAISKFKDNHPERMDRWISVGIAEASGTGVCAGLAKEGKLPVFGTYGVFASGRNWDQLRTTVAYGNFNVLIAGAHGGVSVGPDGATHQALEEIFLISGLPGMYLEVPCDALETQRATEHLLLDLKGPKYVRFAREATPVVTTKETPYEFGVANVIRYRGEKANFIDAFETVLGPDYKNENEDIS
ncbi:MAG: transketolase, partial [Candidatus Eisenbacteria sp.]|nr:transketolase [Candidatus Eisenbacteria bacterium]